MITGPGDEMDAAAAGPGDMRASHADRERVIDTVKAAFARGQLTAGELDARVGQALTARTYAELTAVTLSIPAKSDPARPRPPKPARAASTICWSLRGPSSGFIRGQSSPSYRRTRSPGFRSVLTLLAAYRLVFASRPLQDGPREATALRF